MAVTALLDGLRLEGLDPFSIQSLVVCLEADINKPQ